MLRTRFPQPRGEPPHQHVDAGGARRTSSASRSAGRRRRGRRARRRGRRALAADVRPRGRAADPLDAVRARPATPRAPARVAPHPRRRALGRGDQRRSLASLRCDVGGTPGRVAAARGRLLRVHAAPARPRVPARASTRTSQAWKARLAGAPTLALPTDFPRPRGANAARSRRHVADRARGRWTR